MKKFKVILEFKDHKETRFFYDYDDMLRFIEAERTKFGFQEASAYQEACPFGDYEALPYIWKGKKY